MGIEAISSTSSDCCSVCNTSPASSHFGVISCRSCAAFFRRAIVLHRKYKCKSGGQCNIEEGKDGRTSCGYCRLKKCIKVGMETKKIRPNFDKNGPRHEAIKKPITPVPSAPFAVLPKMLEGYRKFLEDTKTLYFAFHPEHVFSDEIIFKRVTVQEHTFVDRTAIAYYLKMLDNYFCPFKELTVTEKKNVLDLFHFRFSFLNVHYLNTIYFPTDESKQFLHFGAYADAESIEFFFSQYRHPTEHRRTFAPLMYKILKIAKKFRTVKLDETETAALIGILLWGEVVTQFPQNKYENLLDQVQLELAQHCRNTYHIDNCRIGKLMCLLRGLEEVSLMLTEGLAIGMIMNDIKPERNTDLFKT